MGYEACKWAEKVNSFAENMSRIQHELQIWWEIKYALGLICMHTYSMQYAGKVYDVLRF